MAVKLWWDKSLRKKKVESHQNFSAKRLVSFSGPRSERESVCVRERNSALNSFSHLSRSQGSTSYLVSFLPAQNERETEKRGLVKADESGRRFHCHQKTTLKGGAAYAAPSWWQIEAKKLEGVSRGALLDVSLFFLPEV